MRREDAHKGSAARNKGYRLYGSKLRTVCNGLIRTKVLIQHDIFNNDGAPLPQCATACRATIRLYASEKVQKFRAKAALRINGKIARTPVHKLNISKAGSGQL